MKKKQLTKESVYFIATKYKNNPAQVAFYTKEGRQVSENRVEKEPTKSGVLLYTFAV